MCRIVDADHVSDILEIFFFSFQINKLFHLTEEDDVEDEEEPEGEDLDSEEYEEDDDDDRPNKKKKKKERFGGFIIDEAEVDDEVDEDEEWEDGANEIGIVNEVDELGPTAREIEIRRRGNLWE